jgi:hypothetical protein
MQKWRNLGLDSAYPFIAEPSSPSDVSFPHPFSHSLVVVSCLLVPALAQAKAPPQHSPQSISQYVTPVAPLHLVFSPSCICHRAKIYQAKCESFKVNPASGCLAVAIVLSRRPDCFRAPYPLLPRRELLVYLSTRAVAGLLSDGSSRRCRSRPARR